MPPKIKIPGPVPIEALNFFKAKGIKPGFDYTDVWKEEHLASFTVAKLMEEDILEDVQASLRRSIEEGVTFEEWAKDIKKTFDKSGWTDYHKGTPKKYRLKTIYDTNTRISRSAGQWQRVERTKKLIPYLVYELGPSANHRPEHASWAGTILPIDDPWWDTHTPINAFGCKCTIRQVGKREAERRGGVSERPPSYDVPWKNPKTGNVEMVPVGIGPGFDYNPGKSRMQGLKRKEKGDL